MLYHFKYCVLYHECSFIQNVTFVCNIQTKNCNIIFFEKTCILSMFPKWERWRLLARKRRVFQQDIGLAQVRTCSRLFAGLCCHLEFSWNRYITMCAYKQQREMQGAFTGKYKCVRFYMIVWLSLHGSLRIEVFTVQDSS